MSIETFYTSTASNQQRATQAENLTSSSTPETAENSETLNTLNFFDAFLQRLIENTKQTGNNTHNASLTPSSEQENTVTAESINIVDILSANKDLQAELAKLSNSELAEVLALNEQSQKIADGDTLLLTTLTDNGETLDTTSILQSLGINLEKQQSSLAGDLKSYLINLDDQIQKDGPELTTLNITPEQITRFQKDIQDLSSQLSTGKPVEAVNEEFLTIFAGIINMVESQQNKPIQVFSINQQPAQISPTTNGDVTPYQLNALAQGGNGIAPELAKAAIQNGDGGSLNLEEESWLDSFDDFEQLVKDALKGSNTKNAEIGNTGKQSNGNLAPNTNSSNAANTAAATTNTNFSALQGWPFSVNGSLFSSLDFTSSMQEMGLTSGTAQTASLSPLTSLISQSQAAGQPHPGTQLVAATISKAAGNGQSKSMTLQMDPPELGRVEVKMKFSADKTVKAVVTAEKPETFLMLQRDAHTLERALQDAGIDTNGSSLSFELADQGFDFNQNGGHDGAEGGQHGRSPTDEDEAVEIIESTMTWHVDPESGHMRYDILV